MFMNEWMDWMETKTANGSHAWRSVEKAAEVLKDSDKRPMLLRSYIFNS